MITVDRDGTGTAREPTCPVCRESSAISNRRLYDDRYGYPGQFHLNRCDRCDHHWLDHDFQPESLRQLYTDYYPSTDNAEITESMTEASALRAWWDRDESNACNWVPGGVRVLDVGCGAGHSLARYHARGCDAYGIDADAKAVKTLCSRGYKVRSGIFNGEIFEPNFFDYVTLDQVIEHVVDPIATLIDVRRVLKPGGHAIVSTPNARGWGSRVFRSRWINWHTPYHLNLFSKGSMRIAAEAADLQVELVRTITSPEWLRYQWSHLVLCPREGERSSFWNPGGAVSPGERMLLKIISGAHRIGVNHLITHTFDAIGKGDNALYVLRKPA